MGQGYYFPCMPSVQSTASFLYRLSPRELIRMAGNFPRSPRFFLRSRMIISHSLDCPKEAYNIYIVGMVYTPNHSLSGVAETVLRAGPIQIVWMFTNSRMPNTES